MTMPAGQAHAKKPWFKRGWGISLIILGVLVIALLCAFAVWVARDVNAINDSYATAEAECVSKVEDAAKYPGGVSFVDAPYVDPSTSIENDRGNTIYNMGGAVDFPNAHGTPVRMKYMCLSEFDGEKIVKTSAVVQQEER